MKYSKIYLILLMVVLGFGSCDKGFEDLNVNPNFPAEVPPELVLTNTIRIAQNIMNSTFVGGDMGACWAQHFAKVQYNAEARYSPRVSVIEGTVWQGFYASVILDAKKMEELAAASGNTDMQGVALVLQAYGFSVLTDVFGAIPFTEALLGEADNNFTPAYDSQDVVYNGIIEMLDRANTLLDGTGDIGASSDILYGGDYTGWKRMANSLKFRALMRISGKTDVTAQLQDIVNNRMVFTSNANEAKLIYLENDPDANPLYENVVFGNRGEWKINEAIVEMLKTLNDPRLPVYAQPNSLGEYRGKPSGYIDVPNNDWNVNNVSSIGLLYLEPTAPGYFMSYAELQLLMAEAAHRGLIAGDAASYYNEGVRASLEANGVDGGFSGYINSPDVVYNATDGLRLISEQKWIALFAQGIEAWSEWRRTKIPTLVPAFEAALSEIPSRYTYPNEEETLNGSNYQAAVSAQGADALTTKVWWMD